MTDGYDGGLGPEDPRVIASISRSGDRWDVRNDAYQTIYSQTGRFPSPIASDILHLAFAVYTADLRIPRSLSDDRWTRNFIVHLPVREPDRWNGQADTLSRVLMFLTGDSWEIRARQMEPFTPPKPEREKPPTLKGTVNRVNLFSGGLDSLVGAIDLLERGETVALAGHHGAGMANQFQQNVLKVIRTTYSERAPEFMFWVQPPKDKRDGEPSMRSRSLLFLALGLGVASALGNGQPLVVAENGLISLNAPLTNPRMGSLSTRTTHPHFIALFRDLLESLGVNTAIEMPYRFQTKGEMLANAANQTVLAEAAKESMSCSHTEAGRYQGRTPGVHCGYCVPCIIRRASMSAANLLDARHDYDVLTGTLDPAGIGADLRAFQMALERFADSQPHEALFRVLGTGPLPPDEAADYAAVYSRGMEEVGKLLMPGRFDGTRTS
jgi:hypothetical protein